MPRMPRRNVRVAVILCVTTLSAPLVAYLWYSAIPISGPTQQEYAVYRALLHHIAVGGKKRLVAADRTSALRLPKYEGSSPPVPVELRVTKIEDASFLDFVDFCGGCGKDFVRKNLKAWPLSPRLESSPALPDAAGSENTTFVTLSRAGFNFWHSRAVLMFTLDCSDAASSTVCVEFGQAYLKRKGDEWIVDNVSASVF